MQLKKRNKIVMYDAVKTKEEYLKANKKPNQEKAKVLSKTNSNKLQQSV